MSVRSSIVHSSFGNNCKSNCTLNICQDATADVELGTGTRPLMEVNANRSTAVSVGSNETPEGIILGVDYNDTTKAVAGKIDSQATIDSEEWKSRRTSMGYTSDQDDDEFEPQSGMVSESGVMKQVKAARYQNVAFTEQHEPYLYDTEAPVDPTRNLQCTDDATLDNFFSRPIKVAEYEWGVTNNFWQQLNPWSAFFENPRVINRIVNYNLLRAKLKMKLVINGSGFHYGRALASYKPMHTFDDLSEDVFTQEYDAIQASQLPHVYLNPTTSQGGEITAPFFWNKNWLSIPDGEWGDMGNLTIRGLGSLEHANGANDRCTISIFVWAEDVELAVLTSAEPEALTAQSGTEIDEANAKGLISGPATAIASTAAKLTNIPRIAPFAKATEIGANAVSDMAKLFGLSAPPLTKTPDPYTPRAVSTMANSTLPQTINKLSLDDKQELSIDPRIAGIGGADALNIKEIAKRESYIGKFVWAEGTAPETAIGSIRVDPCIFQQSIRSAKVAFHFPPCAVAAMPFKYWTGTMRYRFMIACSSFHKGRLKVVYEPNSLASNEYNTNYVQIVDLADRTDFTIEVGNGQPNTLLTHCDPGVAAPADVFAPGSGVMSREDYGNGTITLSIVNELTSPTTATQSLDIYCFVSAGEDFECFVPDGKFQQFVFKPQSGLALNSDFEPQSGSLVEQSVTLHADGMNAQEESAPLQNIADSLGPTKHHHDMLNLVYTGEKIQSFRQLLKRFNLHTTGGIIEANNKDFEIGGAMPMFPFLRGTVDGAVHERDGNIRYNFCNTVLLHWITYSFAGWRGGIRWKITKSGSAIYGELMHGEAEMGDVGVLAYEYFGRQITPIGNIHDAAQRTVVDYNITGNPRVGGAVLPGVKGKIYTSGAVNPTMEFEVPYYNQKRFSPAKVENRTGLAIHEPNFNWRINDRGSTSVCYNMHCAAGEDFQCYFWTGLPVMYYEPTVPQPR